MTKWLGLTTIAVLALVGLVALVGQEPVKVQSGVHICSSVESPTVLQVEGVGTVRLIGVQVAEGTAEATRATELLKRLVEGKLVRIDVCPKQPRDERGNVRAEVFYAEKGQWVSLNRRLIREGLAKLVAEPDCHIDFAKWQPAPVKARLAKTTPAKVQPAQKERRVAAAPPSLQAVPKVRRQAPKPEPIMTPKLAEDLALRTIAVPIAFRDSLLAAEQRLIQTSANLNAWREIRWRVDTLQRTLLPVAARARLTPWRFSQLVLRGQPSPLIAGEINPVLASVGGEPFPQRIIRLGLTNRKETLAELLNWFPDIRQQLLQRLRNLGAQLVGGTTAAAPVGAGPTMGGPGAPFGPMGGPPMGGGPMMGGPGLMGGPGMGAHGGPTGGAGGPPISGPALLGPEAAEMAMGPGMGPSAPIAPMMGPPTMGAPGAGFGGAAPAAAGAVSNFYRYMELARTGMIDPEFAAICVLALEAYREQVDEQIRLATAEYQRAREEWAELKEIIVRELKKLAATPLRR